MGSQLDILQHVHTGQKPYKFTLQNDSEGLITLSVTPDGWDEGGIEYQRSKTYHGVSRSVTVKEITFFKEARDFIKDVYEIQGIEALIVFTAYYLKPDYTYGTLHTGKIDLSTYDINEIGVKCSIIDNDFSTKVFNRDSMEIDLLKLTAIDGQSILPWTDQSVLMPDTSISNVSAFTSTAAGFIGDSPHVTPLTETAGSDFTETQDQAAGAPVDTASSGFFYQSTQDRIIRVHGSGDVEFLGNGTTQTFEFSLYVAVINSDGTVSANYGLYSSSQVGDFASFVFTFDQDIVLLTGQSMIMQATISPTGTTYKFAYNSLPFNADETFDGTPEHDTFGFQYYEAFLRGYQILTGELNPFYSEFFGRTDTPLTTYASDGQVGYIVRGIYFRYAYDGTHRFPMTVKMVDLFKSLDDIFLLGMCIEEISGVKKVRIEERDYFYNSTVVVDISDRIRTEDIEKAVWPEGFYNEIQIGYSAYDYEQVEGLYEYNTRSVFSTIISAVKSKLLAVCPYRGDNQGIRKILKAPSEADYDSTKDYKGDDDIFIVDALDKSGVYTARTDEGFTTVGGTIYADHSFNLMLTPARMLKKWGKVIRAALTHSLDSYLRWQTSDKNTLLFTRLTSETVDLYENADVQVTDLDENIWLNEHYKISAYLTPAEKLAIEANPHGIVKADTDKYGWIENLKIKNNGGIAEFELLRVNLNKITPV